MRWLAPFLALFLFACGAEYGQENAGKGSIIRVMEVDSRGLHSQVVSDLASTRVAADMFEGLTRFDATGAAEAGLADALGRR